MARKKHLINVHTSTGTTAPTGASLYLGEIAVQHTPNDPALWIKVGSAETSTEYEKFIGKTEIINLLEDTKILGSGYTYSGLPYINSSTTIADAFSALTNEMLKDEKVVAAALNDLNVRVDEISAATGDNTELLEYLQENEEVVAGALNNLNERVGVVETHMTGDYIPITGYQTATGTSEEELSLEETDTVNEALGKLQKQMLDNEESIAAGLNDLNTRLDNVDEIIAHNTGITQLSGAVQSFSAATFNTFGDFWSELENKASNNEVTQLSAVTSALSAFTQFLSGKTLGVLTLNLNGVQQGKYCPSANTTINLEIIQEVTGEDVLLTGYELATGITEEELAIVATDTVNEAFGKIQKQNYDNEAVVAGALNDLDERITALEVSGSSNEDLEELSGAVMSKEIVIAAALNDLNSRIVELSGNTGGAETDPVYSASIAATITQQDIDNWNAASGGGSSDPNAITGITMNGNSVSVSGRVAALGTVVTAQTQLSKGTATGTGNVVTDINVSNHQITLVKSYSAAPADQFVTLSGAAHNKITALSAGTISVSGFAHNKITALSAVTTGLNASLVAHTENATIHVTSTEKSTWDGKQNTISDLTAIRNNAASGMAAYNNVNALSAATTAHTADTTVHITSAERTAWNNKVSNVQADWNTTATTDGSYIKNKPTIPTVPTSNTAFTNDAGYITGYTETDPTVPAWAKASSKPTYTASEVGALPTGTTLDNVADGTTRKLSNYATTGTVNTLSNTVTAHTADTTIHVTTAQTAAWNGKQDAISDLTTIRSNAASGMTAYNNVNALSAATSTHIGNGGIHVTSTEKSTWNGKQDAISDLDAIRSNAASGMAAYNNVNALSAGTISELAKKSNTGHTHAISDITNLQTTLDGKSGTGHTHSNYATTGNVNTLSSATQSIQSSAQTAYNSRITGGTITSGATNSITTTNNMVAITAATLPSYSTANNDQVLMIKNGVPQWVTPATITYSSSQPTGGNDGDIWIQTS